MSPSDSDRDSGSEAAAGIPTADVLAALDRICAHPEFVRSHRQTEFLRFVVQAVLRGDGDDLKEYTVGVSAFGKGPNFEPKTDSSVRSEASRIRTKLEAIYASEPEAHHIRIVLPKGTYRPSFEQVPRSGPAAHDPAGRVTTDPVATAPDAPGGWRGYALAMLLVAVVLAAGAWRLAWSMAPPATLRVSRFDAFNGDRRVPMIAPDGTHAVFSELHGSLPFLFVSKVGGSPTPLEQQGEHAAWSPDGMRLAFRSQRDGGGLFVLEVDTRLVRRVATEGYHPAWSPDGARIVYSSERFERPEARGTTRSQLTVLDLAAGTSRRIELPASMDDAIQPSWSPDARWIAFWSVDSGGRRDVFVIPAGGGAPLRMSEPDALDWNPVWSPDGRLYWSSNQGGTTNLWRVRVGEDGAPASSPEQILLPSTYAGHFSFARDGRLLYANLQQTSAVFRTTIASDLSVTGPVRVTPETLRVRHPSRSPDGEWFVAYILDPNEDLVIFRRDGSGMRRLTDDAFRDRGPVWSPDGRRIAFVSNRGGDYQLWSIQPDGRGLEPLTEHPGGAFAPIWASDGRQLAWFERGRRANRIAIGSPRPAPVPLAPGVAWVPTAWWQADRALLGSSASDDESDSPLVSYSLDTGALHTYAVRGRGPFWLVEGRVLAYWRDSRLHALDVATGAESTLLTASGSVSSRADFSARDRTLLFEARDSRVELWVASVP